MILLPWLTRRPTLALLLVMTRMAGWLPCMFTLTLFLQLVTLSRFLRQLVVTLVLLPSRLTDPMLLRVTCHLPTLRPNHKLKFRLFE